MAMKKNTFIVYKHTNLINGKIYIGITCHGDNPNIRWQGGSGYSKHQYFYNDIIKYGWDNFSHEILESHLDIINAIKKEKEYILEYNSTNPDLGYNISPGGNILSEAGKKRLSQALTGIKRSQESIDKQMQTKQKRYGSAKSINYRGVTRKVRCIETGDIFYSIADANRWANSTKIVLCCSGQRKHAGRHPETGQLLSWEYVDNNLEHTIACEDKMNTSVRPIYQPVICLTTGEKFASIADAGRKYNLPRSAHTNISRCCKGERKTAGKHPITKEPLKWKYLTKEEFN